MRLLGKARSFISWRLCSVWAGDAFFLALAFRPQLGSSLQLPNNYIFPVVGMVRPDRHEPHLGCSISRYRPSNISSVSLFLWVVAACNNHLRLLWFLRHSKLSVCMCAVYCGHSAQEHKNGEAGLMGYRQAKAQ